MPDESGPLEPPQLSVPPPPDHVVDPIPPPENVEEVITSTTEPAIDLEDLGSDTAPADLPPGTEGSAAGERVHMEPSDIAVGHLGTEDLLKDAPAPPPGWEDRETFDERVAGSKDATDQAPVPAVPPPKGPADTTPLWLKLVWGMGGVILLIVIAAFLFSNGSGDTNAVSVPDQTVASAVDSGPEPTVASESVEEQATDSEPVEEPASGSGQATDPAGDNGANGTGADILGLEYLQDDEFFTALLTMGFSPLESSILWYSYYLEVTFIRFSGAIQVMIWENHAGESRSGELDSEGTANGEGVTLTDEAAEFRLPSGTADDPVTEIRVKALSLVEQDSPFTQDEMEVGVGSG
jgi:hypothetical protein